MARLAPRAESWEDETAMIVRLREIGVSVSPGRIYHFIEKGWARVSFAVEKTVLEEALRRMHSSLKSSASGAIKLPPTN